MKVIIEMDDKKFEGKYCDTVHVRVIDDLNIQTTKYVDLRVLLEAFQMYSEESSEWNRIGELPKHFYDGLFTRGPEGLISGKFITIVPAKIVRATFEQTVYQVPFPTLLFMYAIKDSTITETQVYALKGDKWDNGSALYNYPFGNVRISTHVVCWGYNALPRIPSLKTLDVTDSLFIDSPCNNDYYEQGKSTILDYPNLRGVFESLVNKTEFPEDILVRSNDINCIGELFYNN